MDFYKILKELTKDQNLEYTDIHVMAVLITFAQYEDNQSVEMSYKDIHDEFERIPIPTIRDCIRRLINLHYIEKQQGETQKNKYKVLIPIPKIQAQPSEIYQKKNPYKQSHEQGTTIEEYKRVATKNPYLN